jgi:hypothetical protein
MNIATDFTDRTDLNGFFTAFNWYLNPCQSALSVSSVCQFLKLQTDNKVLFLKANEYSHGILRIELI